MKYKRCLLFVTLASLLLPKIAGATKPDPPDWQALPHFGVLLTVAEEPVPRLGERFRIAVESGNQGLRDAVGEVHIEIPPGIEVVDGATAREVRASPRWGGPLRADWDLWLRPTQAGEYTIRGFIRIPRGTAGSWDESECALDLDVRTDSLIVPRFSRTLRHERVVGGQRFRHGGKHLVLIDAPEPWLADSRGTQVDPVAIDKPSAMCAECGLKEPRALRFVVTVGTDGTVRWIEPRAPGAPPEDPRVLQAAESALMKWRFRPARIGDRVIANWAEVDVVVRAGER